MVAFACIDQLQQIQLISTVLVVRQGVHASINNFLGMLEQYNPDACTFFTPVGEIGISPWEMQRVSRIPACEFPYEEHVPPSIELESLKVQDPELYSTYWEVLCHFLICEKLKGRSRGGLAYLAWAKYLFPEVGGDKIKKPSVFSESQAQRLAAL